MMHSTLAFRLFTAVVVLLAGPAQGQPVYALLPSTNTSTFGLGTFDAASPGTLTRIGLITGLGGLLVAGIERRPATGQLYALGYNNSATAGQAQLFVINSATAVATPVGPSIPLNLSSGLFRIGFAFDPATDEVRVVSAAGYNYRLNPTSGALLAAETSLSYAAADPRAGQTPEVGSIAFSLGNAGRLPMAFGIDKTAGTVVMLNPAATGTLNTVGLLGINLNTALSSIGIGSNAVAGTFTVYLVRSALTQPFVAIAHWYQVDPTTGAATLLGTIGPANGLNFISDIAVAPSVVSATRTGAALSGNLYPNPTSGEITWNVILARAGGASLTVFDSVGRQVSSQAAAQLSAGPHALRWSAQDAAPGLYFLHLTVDGVPAGTQRLLVK
jgi:hypothetical protein